MPAPQPLRGLIATYLCDAPEGSRTTSTPTAVAPFNPPRKGRCVRRYYVERSGPAHLAIEQSPGSDRALPFHLVSEDRAQDVPKAGENFREMRRVARGRCGRLASKSDVLRARRLKPPLAIPSYRQRRRYCRYRPRPEYGLVAFAAAACLLHCMHFFPVAPLPLANDGS